MGWHDRLKVMGSIAGVVLYLQCSSFSTTEGGFGSSSGFGSGVIGTGGMLATGAGGAGPTLGQTAIVISPSQPETTGGAAGFWSGGAAGAGGKVQEDEGDNLGATPVIPDGSVLAGIWDDNSNSNWFWAAVQTTSLGFAAQEYESAQQLATTRVRPHRTLDMALVIDTTGSMGDELAYLQAEAGGLWQAFAERYPDAAQRWALVAYRDQGDNYVTQSHDFTASLQQYQDALNQLVAEGGGDLAEASDEALANLNALDWDQDDDTLRVAFWFTDAPHHPENSARMAQTLRDTQSMGIAINPVASINTSYATSVDLRVAAQITGGRYLFMVEPTLVSTPTPQLPCYHVARLAHTMQRVVHVGMGGQYLLPDLETLVGSVGAPVDGVCTVGVNTAQAW